MKPKTKENVYDKYSPTALPTNDTGDDDEFQVAPMHEDEDLRCGIGSCHPPCLQPFASTWGFMTVYTFISFVQGCYFTYFLSVLTTIERRFGLMSRTSGIVMSGNEISQILFSLILNYYGGKGHRPRWIAFGMLCCTFSCFLLASPHWFLGSQTEVQGLLLHRTEASKNQSSNTWLQEQSLCRAPGYMSWFRNGSNATTPPSTTTDFPFLSSTTTPKPPTCEEGTDAKAGMVIIFLALFIAGIGLSVYYSLGFSFIDDQVKASHSSFLIGFSSSIRTIGPFCGFVLGYACLSIYVDPGEDPGINKYDPRWMGAWWLGFIILGVPLFLTSLILMLFPRRLPTPYTLRKIQRDSSLTPTTLLTVDKSKTTQNAKKRTPEGAHGARLPKSVKELKDVLVKLFKNKVYLCHNGAVIFHITGAIGFFTFMPKYYQSQFLRSPADASILTGLSGVLVQAVGMILGGWVIKRFKPRARYVVGWSILVTVLYIIGLLIAMSIGCKNIRLHGSAAGSGQWNVTAACNAPCNCRISSYNPICSEDGRMHFFNPCLAGCRKISVRGQGKKVYKEYSECSCIRTVSNSSSILKRQRRNLKEHNSRKSIEDDILGSTDSPKDASEKHVIFVNETSEEKEKEALQDTWNSKTGAIRVSDGSTLETHKYFGTGTSPGIHSFDSSDMEYETVFEDLSRKSTASASETDILMNNMNTDSMIASTNKKEEEDAIEQEEDEMMAEAVESGEWASAVGGFCPNDDCARQFVKYMVIIALVKLFSSTGRVGGTLITLRSVDQEDKSVAMGLSMMIFSVFAFIPAPIIFGAIIDSTCLIWRSSSKCQEQGNCTLYDADAFRTKLHLSTSLFLAVALIFDFLVWYYSKDLNMYPDEEAEISGKENGTEMKELNTFSVDVWNPLKPADESDAEGIEEQSHRHSRRSSSIATASTLEAAKEVLREERW